MRTTQLYEPLGSHFPASLLSWVEEGEKRATYLVQIHRGADKKTRYTCARLGNLCSCLVTGSAADAACCFAPPLSAVRAADRRRRRERKEGRERERELHVAVAPLSG